jgi:hypothetical protein
MGMLMSAIMMRLGMAAFFFPLLFDTIAKTQQRYLQKLGKEPYEKYNKLNVTAKVLFAPGMSFRIVGETMTMAAGGK